MTRQNVFPRIKLVKTEALVIVTNELEIGEIWAIGDKLTNIFNLHAVQKTNGIFGGKFLSFISLLNSYRASYRREVSCKKQ